MMVLLESLEQNEQGQLHCLMQGSLATDSGMAVETYPHIYVYMREWFVCQPDGS